MDFFKSTKGGTLWVGRGSNPWEEENARHPPPPSKSAPDFFHKSYTSQILSYANNICNLREGFTQNFGHFFFLNGGKTALFFSNIIVEVFRNINLKCGSLYPENYFLPNIVFFRLQLWCDIITKSLMKEFLLIKLYQSGYRYYSWFLKKSYAP